MQPGKQLSTSIDATVPDGRAHVRLLPGRQGQLRGRPRGLRGARQGRPQHPRPRPEQPALPAAGGPDAGRRSTESGSSSTTAPACPPRTTSTRSPSASTRASRVVYVDNDPMVLAHGRALLEQNESTAVIHADMRDTEAIFAHPDTERLIDFSQPVAVLFNSVLHCIPDSETDGPPAVVRRVARTAGARQLHGDVPAGQRGPRGPRLRHRLHGPGDPGPLGPGAPGEGRRGVLRGPGDPRARAWWRSPPGGPTPRWRRASSPRSGSSSAASADSAREYGADDSGKDWRPRRSGTGVVPLHRLAQQRQGLARVAAPRRPAGPGRPGTPPSRPGPPGRSALLMCSR